MTIELHKDALRGTAVNHAERPHAVRYHHPIGTPVGLVISCPHSGQFYPPEMCSASRLDRLTLRRTEDAFVDELFDHAPRLGADLLVSEFARAFVDVNRGPDELDPRLIKDVTGIKEGETSQRVQAGLGVIPRTLGDDLEIYETKLEYQSAMDRIAEVHVPWHQAIERCLVRHLENKGRVLLLDCHSMPSHGSGDIGSDIILGDRFGSSCSGLVSAEAVRLLREQGLSVSRNDPYPGGYTTQQYGKPMSGCHALQIEINRSLYMVEGAMTRRPRFDHIKNAMSELVKGLAAILPSL
jgi:N-formylglutamate amidohydrolase